MPLYAHINTDWPLTGRHGEMDLFERALQTKGIDACFIRGDRGTGKTRLAAEFLKAAQSSGRRIGKAIAHDPEGAPFGAIAHLLPPDVDATNPIDYWKKACEKIVSKQGRGRRARFVLHVDEAHLLDPASSALIGQLINSGMLFLIATVRNGASPNEALSRLESLDTTLKIEISELNTVQVRSLLESVFGGVVTPAMSKAFFEYSAGNPYILRELIAGNLRSSSIVKDSGVWNIAGNLRITSRLKEFAVERLKNVSAGAQRALEMLAACEPVGAEFFSPDVVAELESAKLAIMERIGRRRIIRVSRPLYSAIVLEEMPSARRNVLLLEQANFIQSYGRRRSADKAVAAANVLSATGKIDERSLLQGAMAARRIGSFEVVHDLAAASSQWRGTRFLRHFLLGESLHEMGNLKESAENLKRAMSCARNDIQFALSALLYTQASAWEGTGHRKAVEVSAAACSKVTSRQMRALLSVNHAAMLALFGHPRKSLSVLDDTSEDLCPHTHYYAQLTRVFGLVVTGRAQEALRLGISKYEAGAQRNQNAISLNSPYTLAPVVLALSEGVSLHDAFNLGEKFWLESSSARNSTSHVFLSLVMARCALQRGLPNDALRWSGQAVALCRGRSNKGALRAALSFMSEACVLSRQFDLAEKALSEAVNLPKWGPFVLEECIPAALLAAESGDFRSAQNALLRAARRARESNSVMSETRLLAETVRLGDAERAAQCFAELRSVSDGNYVSACTSYAIARAARDPELMDHSSAQLDKIGATLLAAEASAIASVMWRKRGRSGQSTIAGNESVRLAKICDGAMSRDLATAQASTPLTTREMEIASLVTQGLTSMEVADHAKISRRTVENHLQNVYRKLGVTNRRSLRMVLKGR
ncbi:LuxR family transcriptional regulator [Streptomyces sp. NPDC019396]|uniref:LuxR family transcriptional regulator n=1 Tax=Streptomyces sp. NPDC019396 TaxID=3154687 RepID=UPI0033F6EDED